MTKNQELHKAMMERVQNSELDHWHYIPFEHNEVKMLNDSIFEEFRLPILKQNELSMNETTQKLDMLICAFTTIGVSIDSISVQNRVNISETCISYRILSEKKEGLIQVEIVVSKNWNIDAASSIRERISCVNRLLISHYNSTCEL